MAIISSFLIVKRSMSDRSKRRDAEALCVKEAMQEAPSCPEAKPAGMHAGHEHETRWTHRVPLFARSPTTSSTSCHFSLNKQIYPVIEIFDELLFPNMLVTTYSLVQVIISLNTSNLRPNFHSSYSHMSH